MRIQRLALAGVATLLLAAGCGSHSPSSGRSSTPAPAASSSSPPPLPDSAQVGTPGWELAQPVNGQAKIEGFADQVSVLSGAKVGLFISTSASAYKIEAFRFGAYQGTPAKLVWSSESQPGEVQAAAREIVETRTPYAPWHRSILVDTTGWAPGGYLFKLEPQGTQPAGRESYIPLTVRSPSAVGRVVVIDSVTTWQAYNDWGGRSLYHGSNGANATRAYAVSFDRPYGFGDGGADFLGNERPLITFAASLGIPLAFATDVDLERDPHLLDGARAVISLGHDEYYSIAMRAALTTARDNGTNIAFLGANAVYRIIRLSPTPLGQYRLQTDYKSYDLDPMRLVDPSQVTVQWPDGPVSRPESALTGAMYECNGTKADMIVADADDWPIAGTGLKAGQALHLLVGDEYDSYSPQNLAPAPIQVLFHSPLVCSGNSGHADATYYTVPSGAGVFGGIL